MKQVYRIDEDGYYIEPVLIAPEQVPVEVQMPNPNYVPFNDETPKEEIPVEDEVN